MSAWRQLSLTLVIAAILASITDAKVFVQWSGGALPAAKILGIDDLVVPWSDNAQSLVANAKKQGYRVYFEASLQESEAVAKAAGSSGAAGIILKGDTAAEVQLQDAAGKLRATYPKLKVLVLSASGKQPEMRGWLVFMKNGILQVSSPTSQPWLDQNLAMVRHERAFENSQRPLYSFSWDVSDPVVQQNGPSAADYSLAIAEAGAFHADLILPLHARQAKGLASGDKQVLGDWQQVQRTIAFYDSAKDPEDEAAAVAVLTNDFDSSYEPINLMARHNISFRVLHAESVKAQELQSFDVVIAFAPLTPELTEALRAFAERGGVAVLVNLPGHYPWDSPSGGKASDHSTTYSVGKGRVIELGEPVADPETFAQDIRRLMAKDHVPVALWNSLTTLVAEYLGPQPGSAIVELVNYDQEPTQLQVQVRGTFAGVRYETPEKGCCETLPVSHIDGFTDFVVPDLLIGGRVHLQAATGHTNDETKTRIGE